MVSKYMSRMNREHRNPKFYSNVNHKSPADNSVVRKKYPPKEKVTACTFGSPEGSLPASKFCR
jgi:hypothetical protein